MPTPWDHLDGSLLVFSLCWDVLRVVIVAHGAADEGALWSMKGMTGTNWW